MNKKYYDEELIRLAGEQVSSAKDLETYKQALAVYLPGEFGMSLENTAQIMNCNCSTVVNLRKSFYEEQKNGKKRKKNTVGNNRNLTIEEEREFINKFLDKAKSGEITVAKQIKLEYEELVGHKVPKSTIYRMLKRHDWRKIKPRKKHPKTDRKVQEAFKKNLENSCKK